MGRKKYTLQQKLEAIENITDRHMSAGAVAKLLGCGESPLRRWLRLYQNHGIDGLSMKQTYTGHFKIEAVEYMHKNRLSANMTAPILGIPHPDQLLKWERIYYEEGPQALCEERRGKSKYMEGKKRGRPSKQPRADIQEDLIAEVQRLRMENEYLKKLNVLVQERIKRENGKK